MQQILIIALPTPLRRLFEYRPPKGACASSLTPGVRVRVPFGPRELVGILVNTSDETSIPEHKLKHAIQIVDEAPILNDEIMSLCLWVAEYYQHPIGEALLTALPTLLRKDKPIPVSTPVFWAHTQEGKGLPFDALKRSPKQQQLHQLLLSHKELSPDQLTHKQVKRQTALALQQKKLIHLVERTEPAIDDAPLLNEAPQKLNDEQHHALEQIKHHHYKAYLLDGTTGSGKTEVYLHAIARTLQAGHQALVLVPEIGLAPQTLSRFRQRFNVAIVELHSQVSNKQRALNWLDASTGRARIIIGTRLAIFTPLPDLGIIIIDEEHDLSFKQQDGLRYSARDIAVMRAYRKKIPLLMGSATPSLESLFNIDTKNAYQHLQLTQRAGNAKPPSLTLTDMRKQQALTGIALSSIAAIKATLARDEQVLVFINRRGFAPALICHHCGWTASCTFCDAKLTLHNKPYHLCCHHCSRRQQPPTKCPSCFSPQLNALGQGTERCEETLQSEFPNTDVLRVDQDSMRAKGSMAKLYERLQSGEPCILIGTQMLAKGHHFPKVTLVLLLDLDQGLFSGDFRGIERMAQQIVQVSGRSGRGDIPGQVILQTHKPDHPMLQLLLTSGYHTLAQTLLRIRSDTHLPPISHMAILRAESKRIEHTKAFLEFALAKSREIFPPSPNHQYLGPIPALLERRNEHFRFQLQIKYNSRAELQHLLTNLLTNLEGTTASGRVRWSIDVDPQDMA